MPRLSRPIDTLSVADGRQMAVLREGRDERFDIIPCCDDPKTAGSLRSYAEISEIDMSFVFRDGKSGRALVVGNDVMRITAQNHAHPPNCEKALRQSLGPRM
jgi:hypothetical protein